MRLYGLRVAWPASLRLEAPAVDDPPADLAVSLAAGPPPGAGPPAETLWESPERGPGGGPDTRLERRGAWWLLRFAGIGDFFVGDGRVVAVPDPEAAAEIVELRLLGPVLAFVLELRGAVTLHASAVAAGGRGAAFLATHGGGKSSMAAALIQRGAGLLTDDLLVLEVGRGAVRARAGYPQMRLWPAAAEHFTGSAERWPRVHPSFGKRRVEVGPGGFGAFHPAPVPLAAILLPDHRPGAREAGLAPLAPSEAVMALVAGSYLPRLAPAAGLGERRLGALARLAEAVPVLRLRYPRGYDRLDRAAERVEALLAEG